MNKIFSSRKKNFFTYSLFEPFILFCAFFLPGYLAQGFQEAASDMFESLFFNIYYMITIIPQTLLVLYLIFLKPGINLNDFNIVRIKLSDLWKSLLTLAGIYLCIIPAGLIAVFLVPELDNPAVYGSGWQFNNLRMLPIVFLTCIITGYSEEIFFRSYLFTSLKNAGVPFYAAAAAVTLLFGAGHIYEGFYAFAATSLIGAFLMFVFVKTGSIHTVAIGHGLYNFSVLISSMKGEL